MTAERPVRPGVLVLLAALLAAGCSGGPAVGEVRGKVTFKKTPVAEGKITFLNPTSGFAAEAELGKDGGYEVKNKEGGLVVGEYVVMVNPPIVMDNSDPKTPPSPVEKVVPNIPARYRSQGTTPLRAKVEKGENTFDFDLTPR